MCNRTKTSIFKAAVIVGALALSQAALAGRVILNHDEWTFSDRGFAAAPTSTAKFANNLASYMNIGGGSCDLLVYSENFGLTQSLFNTALYGAGCSVTYSTGAFDLATLSAFDGVLLGGRQFNYNAATLISFVNSGHSAYIAAGTAGVDSEDTAWDSFTDTFGLDFGPSYNEIRGTLPLTGGGPLLAGVSELYFNNGNTVSLFGSNPDAEIVAVQAGIGGQPPGLIGVYDDIPDRINPENDVPEPATLALLGLGLAGLGLSRRRSN